MMTFVICPQVVFILYWEDNFKTPRPGSMTDFSFLTTHVGSIPHPSVNNLTDRLHDLLDAPAWPQLSQRSFRESMYVQYSPSLPAIREDSLQEKVYFDTNTDLTESLETFYTAVLAEDLDNFALRPDYANGFFAMLDTLRKTEGEWAKGQVTGPISFGLTVTDQDLRASLYDEMLADVIVKNVTMNARWQIRQLRSVRKNVILFLDEPYMAAFGSAFISLDREQVITYLDEAFDAIHAEGGITGVHCCANTDWSVLLGTKVDILNLDAYGFVENLALYPAELREYLDRGGSVCWGIIPNNEKIFDETSQGLADRLRNGINLISEKAAARGVMINADEFATRSLIAPACGLGSTSIEVADRVFEMLAETGNILKSG
jgi:hypothetical protein